MIDLILPQKRFLATTYSVPISVMVSHQLSCGGKSLLCLFKIIEMLTADQDGSCVRIMELLCPVELVNVLVGRHLGAIVILAAYTWLLCAAGFVEESVTHFVHRFCACSIRFVAILR